jgi:hypothetical protein
LLLGPAHVTNLLQIKNSPDEHRSIGPGSIVAAVDGEPHAMHILFLLGVFFEVNWLHWAGPSNNEFTP